MFVPKWGSIEARSDRHRVLVKAERLATRWLTNWSNISDITNTSYPSPKRGSSEECKVQRKMS
jgi:hypothetical protein